MVLKVGETFSDPGATATDNVSGNLTSQITVSGGPVTTAGPRTFTLTYSVRDAAQNVAVPVTRRVTVIPQMTVMAK